MLLHIFGSLHLQNVNKMEIMIKEDETRGREKSREKILEFTGNYCVPMKRRRKKEENE